MVAAGGPVPAARDGSLARLTTHGKVGRETLPKHARVQDADVGSERARGEHLPQTRP